LITGYDPRVTTGLIVRYGNVGIGTTAPDSKLHVIGGICAESSDTGCSVLAGYVRGNAGLCIGSDCRTSWPAGGGGIGGSGTTNYLTKFTDSTTIGNSQIFDDGTNVGIGTMSPGAKLEVAGQIKITGGSPGAGKVLTSDGSGLASWATSTAGGSLNCTITAGTWGCTCPEGYARTGCGFHGCDGSSGSAMGAWPSGTNGCAGHSYCITTVYCFCCRIQ
jgi:hypothetical protein